MSIALAPTPERVRMRGMPRPKPVIPLVGFNVRLPQNEAEALGPIVNAWATAYAAELAAKGVHIAPPADKTAWLRTMIREQAAKHGVIIPDGSPPAPPPAPPKRTSRKK